MHFGVTDILIIKNGWNYSGKECSIREKKGSMGLNSMECQNLGQMPHN